MVSTMPGRSVTMQPAVVRWQQLVDRLEQVRVRSSPNLYDSHTTGGVRSEYVEQTLVIGLEEGKNVARKVDHDGPRARLECDLNRPHCQVLSPRKISETLESIRIA